MQPLQKGNIIKVEAPEGERFGVVIDYADAYGATDVLYLNIAGSTFFDSTIVDDSAVIPVIGHLDPTLLQQAKMSWKNPGSLN